MQILKDYAAEPYRIFFPMGFLFLVVGIVPWILWSLGLIDFYPRDLHMHAMVGGFLVHFALGFLMTAIPKFTGTTSASLGETSLALFIATFGLFSCCLSQLLWAEISSLLLLGFLVFFAFRRFLRRKWNPPPPFLFLPLGFLAGIIGIMLIILSRNYPQLNHAGRILFYEAMMLSLIQGVGSRLVPALLGWAPLPKIQIETRVAKNAWSETKTFAVLAFLFALSYILQSLGFILVGQVLKAIVVCYVAFGKWKLYRLPREIGALSFGVYLAGWLTLIGVLAPLVPGLSNPHWNHILYLGGFAFITFFIASRVTLAHGGYDLAVEKKSLNLQIVAGLVVLSLILRLWAAIDPEMFSNALLSAAFVFLISSLIWAFYFIPKMRMPTKSRVMEDHKNC